MGDADGKDIEIGTGFARMQGRRALFPQGFHCSGMPIKAAADKIAREIEMFGQDFKGYKAPEEVEEESKDAKAKTDMTKFSGSKSKAVAKTGGVKYQFQVRQSKPVAARAMRLTMHFCGRLWRRSGFLQRKYPSLLTLIIGCNTSPSSANRVRLHSSF